MTPRVLMAILGCVAAAVVLAVLLAGTRHEAADAQTVEADEISPVAIQARTIGMDEESPRLSPRPSARGAAAKSLSGAAENPKPIARPVPPAGPRVVTVPGEAFSMAARAISQSQFREFCQQTSRSFPRQPWDAVDWLSKATGHRYRLPTEQEWLSATRTLNGRAGFSAGNVREWVQDALAAESGAPVERGDDQRIVRGISYADDSTTLLSARRNRSASIRDALTGFRALREVN
jgi:hypothetical protein